MRRHGTENRRIAGPHVYMQRRQAWGHGDRLCDVEGLLSIVAPILSEARQARSIRGNSIDRYKIRFLGIGEVVVHVRDVISVVLQQPDRLARAGKSRPTVVS